MDEECIIMECSEEEWFDALESGLFEAHYRDMEAKAKAFLNSENFSRLEDRRQWQRLSPSSSL